jgi:hypothetical protein
LRLLLESMIVWSIQIEGEFKKKFEYLVLQDVAFPEVLNYYKKVQVNIPQLIAEIKEKEEKLHPKEEEYQEDV